MATTMIPEADVPQPAPAAAGTRFVQVRANLLPDEVISARQAVVVRKQVLVALGALVVVIIAWFGLSWWQTNSAQSDLEDLQRQNVALSNQQNEFRPLVEAQTGARTIQAQLKNLMAGDVSWKAMLGRLRAAAPSGVTLTGITATMTAGAAGQGTTAVAAGPSLNQTGKQQIGTLQLQGDAKDKNSVAAYADTLAKVPGIAAPLISSVTSAANGITFTIQLVITTDALGGRYSAPTASTGGR